MNDRVINGSRPRSGILKQKGSPFHAGGCHKPVKVLRGLVSPVSLAVNPVKFLCVFQGGRRHYLILIFCFHAAKMTVWHGSLKDRIYIFTAMTPAL